MTDVVFTVNGMAVTAWQFSAGLAGLIVILLLGLAVLLARLLRQRAADSAIADDRQDELDARTTQLHARLQTMAEVLNTRQSDMARFMAERIESVGQRVGLGLDTSTQSTADNLTKLNERLAVIDAAQARLTRLTQEVVGLKEILANKQARGAFGQGRMEAIVRDGLPVGAYSFQHDLPNGTRPDCVIRLPGDERFLVIDAKFPLEAFTALKAAATEDEKRQAAARVRNDFGKHVKDIAQRYLIPGKTQDIAILFVPSESVYADLNEFFDDVVHKAMRARVIIVSPTLLMMAIQVMQAIVRDARLRDEIHVVQVETAHLMEDVRRLRDRAAKLARHFEQAEEDVSGVGACVVQIGKRADRIMALDFGDRKTDSRAAE